MNNLFSNIPTDLESELVETLLDASNVRIERIISHGQASPNGYWYDQQQHEWVIVLKGAARIRFDGDDDVIEMRAGNFVNIPARRKHRVEWTTPNEPTIWLAIHYL